jgi:hypothetical protein
MEHEAAKLPVSYPAKTDFLLSLHDFGDTFIFDRAQFVSSHLPTGTAFPSFSETCRTQEAADVVCAKWWRVSHHLLQDSAPTLHAQQGFRQLDDTLTARSTPVAEVRPPDQMWNALWMIRADADPGGAGTDRQQLGSRLVASTRTAR